MWRAVRKFWVSPEFCDLPTMIWNISVLLRMLTLNIDNRYTKRIPFIFQVFTVTAYIFYYYAYLVSMIWFVLVRCTETGDLVAAMVVLSLGVMSENPTMKFIYMLSARKRIRRMVQMYLECDALTIPGSRFSRNLAKCLIGVKQRAVFFWSLIMCNGLIYVSTPLLQSGRHLIEDYYVIYGLEPMFESPNYEIATFVMTICVYFVCIIASNVTAFLIIIAGYTEAQMLALSEETLNVWDDSVLEYTTINFAIDSLVSKQNTANDFDDNAKVFINIEVRKRLIQLIQNHARNIRLHRQTEDIFRVSIAIGFVFLIFGLIAELLGGIENTFLEMPHTFGQVAMDCWTGQRLIDASVAFERAVYACKWENFDRNNMKLVLVMLQSSQKTMTLSAGGIAMLSFSCLMSVIKTVYSAFTTLQSTMK